MTIQRYLWKILCAKAYKSGYKIGFEEGKESKIPKRCLHHWGHTIEKRGYCEYHIRYCELCGIREVKEIT